jgi:sugar lactone lactonase YvrE
MAVVSIAVDEVDILGEAPQWNGRDNCLYWVDAFRPAIRKWDPASNKLESYTMPCDIGSFVFTTDGRVVAGMRSGFNLVDLAHGSVELIANPLQRDARLLLNDGKCDRAGRYWCGSVHSDFIGRQAELFCLDTDLSVRKVDGGFIVGNGIAFSPDNTRMYFADSRDETVWVYDFDLARGTLSNRRVFFSTADMDGRVDGAACDTEGNYWCALVHGGAVGCISPDGKLIEQISVPAKHPTMVAFGGDDLATLYVTSASSLLAPEETALWPDAGKLFQIDGVGARGLAEPLFQHEFPTGRVAN